jgi:hypothetical protein
MTLHWLRLDAQGASRLETLPALAMHIILADDVGQKAVLERGNLLFTEGNAGLRGSIRHRGACQLVQVAVTSPWPEAGANPLALAGAPAAPARVPNLQRLYKGEGERAYFRSFHELFVPAGHGRS